MNRRVHVTLHDVCPTTEAELEQALALCARVGARPGLLVVPNFHRRCPLERAPAFVDKLRALVRRGTEIFLHGYYHQADELRRGPGGWFRQRVVSNREAEFGELDSERAVRRIDAGLSLFAELGLPVDGFVAPAWVLPRSLLPALASRGVRYTETHLLIADPVARCVRPSLVLNFATRSRARWLASSAFCRGARPLSRWLPARIALHPADLRSAHAIGEVRNLLEWGRGAYVERAAELFS